MLIILTCSCMPCCSVQACKAFAMQKTPTVCTCGSRSRRYSSCSLAMATNLFRQELVYLINCQVSVL